MSGPVLSSRSTEFDRTSVTYPNCKLIGCKPNKECLPDCQMIFQSCLLKYLKDPWNQFIHFKVFVFCSRDESCISKVTFVVQVSSNLLEISRFMWVLLSGSPLSLLGTISFFLICFDCRHGSSLLHNTQYGHSHIHSLATMKSYFTSPLFE